MIIRRVILKLNEPTRETGRIYQKTVIRKMIKEYLNGVYKVVSLVSFWEKKNYNVNYSKVYGSILNLKIIKNNLVARIKIYDTYGLASGSLIAQLLKQKAKIKFSPAFIAETDTKTHKVKYCKLINIHPKVNDEYLK